MTRKKKRKLVREKAATDLAKRAPRVRWESTTIEAIGTVDDIVAIAAGVCEGENREDVQNTQTNAKDLLDDLSANVTRAEHEIYGYAQLDIKANHIGVNADDELELATHETIHVITINGEQVPATIVRDPTA